VLLSSGYIAGGTLCGLIIAFFAFLPAAFNSSLDLGSLIFGKEHGQGETVLSQVSSLTVFLILGLILLIVGTRKSPELSGETAPPGGDGQPPGAPPERRE
jgi:hypothetical protein